MGILNRMWTKVWQDEETKKRHQWQAEHAMKSQALYQELTAKYAKQTETQKLIEEQGGFEDEDPNQYYNALAAQAQLQLQNQNHQLVYNQQAMQNQQAIHMVNTTPYQGNTLTTIGTAPYQGAGGWQSNISTVPSTVVTWPTLGTSDRDLFFMALKGIEEAAMKKPEGNHKYDDHAVVLQDLRYFDPQKISLLGLTSFCLSNCMEVWPIMVLLQGYGMRIA